jgi:hypothetical protein
MNTIIDYVDWRGDLSFKQSPFNEIDAVIFTQLAYIDFSEIVSSDFNKTILLKDAAVQIASSENFEQRVNFGPLINAEIVTLLQKAGESNRFGKIKLCGYVSSTDTEQEKQFAAISLILENKTNLIIFRGTDQSIVGWKEDFNMAFKMPIPAHIEAVNYFDKACKSLKGKIRVAGHSKGGNLSIFSATYCQERFQKRIIEIYNYDGPGFEQIVLNDKRYINIQKRIRTFVPKKSIVGMLFDTNTEKTIVESSNNGIMQHDPLTWNVLGSSFVTLDEISKESEFINKTLKIWLNKTDKDKRENFIETVFGIIESTEANNITEITDNLFKTSSKMIQTYKNLDAETKEILFETIKIFIKSAKDTVQSSVHEKIQEYQETLHLKP